MTGEPPADKKPGIVKQQRSGADRGNGSTTGGEFLQDDGQQSLSAQRDHPGTAGQDKNVKVMDADIGQQAIGMKCEIPPAAHVNPLTRGCHDYLDTGPAQNIHGSDQLEFLNSIRKHKQRSFIHRAGLYPKHRKDSNRILAIRTQTRYDHRFPMNTAETFSQYVLPTYGRFPLVPVKGQGAYLWDEAGNRYLDFCTGIAVCSIGHCHPALTGAIQAQAATLIHVSNLYQIPQQAELARTIVEDHVKLPGKVFFSNSGAEANDGLIKTARRFGHSHPQASGEARYEVITFTQSFHGRTLGSMAATAQKKVHEGFDPLLPGFRYCPFNDLAALEAAISPITAAILLEPVQGEGGVNCITPEFMRGVAALAKKHDLLLFFDEVQAGFGRCGEAMAWRAYCPEIEPDGISWAKGMGGGFPIGAFWISDRLIDATTPLSRLMNAGSHGSTYGGSPLACAASLAVLGVIHRDGLAAHAAAMERYIRDAFSRWDHRVLTALRGKGLLLGFSLNAAAIPAVEGKTVAQILAAKLMARGLLTVPAGPETLRILPPLNVTTDEIDEALAIIQQTTADITNGL